MFRCMTDKLLKSLDVESLAEAEFDKERFASNQKSLPRPVQKLWSIIWFSQKWWPWPCPSSDFQGQRLRVLSIWLELFKEIVCDVLIFIFHKLNITRMTYKIMKQIIWPWPLTLVWHWPWDWPLTLTIWRKQIVSKFVIYLKLRDVKTWYHTSNRRRHTKCALLQGTFSNQLEVSTTFVSKVMAQRMIFIVIDVFDLDLDI